MPKPSWSFYRQSRPSSLGNDFEPQTVNQHSFCMFFVVFLGQNKKSRQTGQLIGWNAEQISKRTFFFGTAKKFHAYYAKQNKATGS